MMKILAQQWKLVVGVWEMGTPILANQYLPQSDVSQLNEAKNLLSCLQETLAEESQC